MFFPSTMSVIPTFFVFVCLLLCCCCFWGGRFFVLFYFSFVIVFVVVVLDFLLLLRICILLSFLFCVFCFSIEIVLISSGVDCVS